MRNLLWPLMLAACFMPQHAAANQLHQTDPLGLAAALQKAAHYNPDLQSAQHELQARQGGVRQANSLPNPVLSASMEDTQAANRNTTMQLTQVLELGGKRAARVALAETQRELAGAELAIKRAEVRANVTLQFHALLLAQERERLAASSLQLAQQALHAAQQRVTAGKISPIETSRAQVFETTVRQELAQARHELHNARQQLLGNWGEVPDWGAAEQANQPGVPQNSGNTSPSLLAEGDPGKLPPLPEWSQLLTQLAKSPYLLRARLHVEQQTAQVQAVRSSQTSDVSLSLGVKRDAGLGRNQAVLGLGFALPLFDRAQGQMQEALVRQQKARDEASASEKRLRAELQQAWQSLALARLAASQNAQELLPAAENALAATSKGFEYGKFGFLDLLEAQRTLLQVKSQTLRTLHEAHRAASELERLTGSAELYAVGPSHPIPFQE